MTTDEKIIVLADSVNQLAMKIEFILWKHKNLSKATQIDLRKIRQDLAELLPE